MKTNCLIFGTCSTLLTAALLCGAASAQSSDSTVNLKYAFKDYFKIGTAINRTIATDTAVRANNVNRKQEEVQKDTALVI